MPVRLCHSPAIVYRLHSRRYCRLYYLPSVGSLRGHYHWRVRHSIEGILSMAIASNIRANRLSAIVQLALKTQPTSSHFSASTLARNTWLRVEPSRRGRMGLRYGCDIWSGGSIILLWTVRGDRFEGGQF